MLHICSNRGEWHLNIRQDKKQFHIGKNIRKYRLEAHLTQAKTAMRMQLLGIDISRSAYSHLECGIGNISVQELLALSDIFQVPIEAFFENISLNPPADNA